MTEAPECSCASFGPIELNRASITRRIRESKSIRQHLELLATDSELRIYLFRCPTCGQLWQSGHEWNFGDQEYLFQVPPIANSDWLSEPYAQPAAMMIATAVMKRFFAQNKFEPSDHSCRTPDCLEKAIRMSVHCRRHHIEALRRAKLLPQVPIGRIFPPYFDESPDSPG